MRKRDRKRPTVTGSETQAGRNTAGETGRNRDTERVSERDREKDRDIDRRK